MRRRNRNNNKRNNNRRGRRRGPTQVIMSRRDPSFPSSVKAKPIYNRVLRYQSTDVITDVFITRRCMLNLILTAVSGSTNAVNVHESIRLDRVCIYSAPSSVDGLGNALAEIVLTWGGDRGPDLRITDRGTISHPACIKERPPLTSLAGFWSTIYSDMDEPLFMVTMPSNSVIDLHVSCCIGDGAGKTCVIVDPSLTGVVYPALDNAIPAGTVGGNLMRPDGLRYVTMTTP